MAIKYVTPDGNPGPGTEFLPWDLSTAETEALPGDHVIIDGFYSQVFEPKVSGLPGKPITYRAKSPMVHFNGAGLGLEWSQGVVDIKNISYITSIGLGVKDSIYGAVSIRGICETIEVWDTYYENCPVGIWATSAPSYGTIYGSCKNIKICNTFGRSGSVAVVVAGVNQFDIGYTDAEGLDAYAIRVLDGAMNGLVHHSVITGCLGGINVSSGASIIDNVEIESNYLWGNIESGMLILPEGGEINNTKIINNLSAKNTHHGIHLGNLGLRNGLQLINNTFALNKELSIQCPEDNIELLKDLQIQNNILQGNWWFPLIGSFTNSCKNNLFTGHTFGIDFIVGDPSFNDPDNNDFTLKIVSPAVDAGDPIGAPDSDINDYPRDGNDIGAYEDGSQAPSDPPLPPPIPEVEPGQGCTDPAAINYDPTATTDDGSCSYTPPPSDGNGGIPKLPLIIGGIGAVVAGMVVFAKKGRKK